MTDPAAPDLDAAMSQLLEQELMAACGVAPTSAAGAATAAGTAEPAAADLGGRMLADVVDIAAAALRMRPDQLDVTENLANFGVDSIAITEIMARISRVFGIAVAPTTFFEARNLTDLARILGERHGAAIQSHYAASAAPPSPKTETAPQPPPAADLSPWLSRHRALRRSSAKPVETAAAPVAVIAMEGRFPGSPDLDALAAHLAAGDDCISEVPADRWDWRAHWGDPRKGTFTDVKWGGFVDGVDLFDAARFHIAPREAELIDPQHRLFMECVWSLLERAGYAPSSLSGKRVGMFLGINLLDYTTLANRAQSMDAQQMTGLGHAFCPNRLSFLLDVHGPSQVVDTACSSSAVALHRAMLAIRHEGCEMAVAGGSNLMLSPDQHILFSQVGMLSPGGRCRTFAAEADGYARADGVGAVLLKRLDLAERDGDPILGVILASAEHHGGTATSLTAPNPAAQAATIVDACRQAGIDPRTVSMVECHGTGTALGDPVEIEGLKSAFAQLYAERGLPGPTQPHCHLGSIKSNIGHAETAAGIAGLIKLLLAMRDGVQYRSLHCDHPNPLIDLTASPFALLERARPWTRPVVDGIEAPRRAGLSSFGAGGNLVHVLVEEYRPAPRPAPPSGPRPLVVPVSAPSEATLTRLLAALRPLAVQGDFDDLAFTLQVGRDPLRARVAFVAADGADLAAQIDRFLAGDRAGIAHDLSGKKRPAIPAPATIPADAATLAAAWTAGSTVDWAGTWSVPRRRLALPPVPFDRKRYWLPMAEASASAASGFALVAHGPDLWSVALSGSEFFLADHRLGSVPVLPGVAYLELARAAAQAAGLTVTALTRVVWVKPLRVAAPTTVDIRLDRAARLVEISGPDGLHAQIRLDDTAPRPGSLDLDALRAAQTQTHDAGAIYAQFDRLGLNYGPGHRAIASLSTGPGPQVLAHLTLPTAVDGSLEAFPLHPSLMDGAFQAALGMALDDGDAEAALPFAIDRVDLIAPCRPRMWVHVRAAERSESAPRVRTLDLDLTDDQGRLCVRLRGFATRLPAAQRQSVLTFAPVWRRLETTAPPPGPRPRVLWADDVAAPTLALDARYGLLARTLLKQAQENGGPIQVVVADGAEAEPLCGLAGLLRSVALERPGQGGQIAVVPAHLDRAHVETRLAEAAAAPLGLVLRLEDGVWWRQGWEDVPLPAAAPPFADGKVYLITGGLGGVGRLLAAAIRAAAPGAHVVLAGRRCDQTARAWLDSQGSGVEFHAVDLTDSDAVAALVAGIRARLGRLDGVLHAAGVLRDAPLARKSADQMDEVLAAKVAGTLALDRALGDAPLDFLVLFSSVAAAWGNVGQTDYAAANGFLDGFAALREARRRAGLAQGRTVAVAWPLWAEGGMRLDAEAQALMTRTTGLVPLPTAAALDVLAAAIAAEPTRVLTLVGDAARLRRRMEDAPTAAEPEAAPVTQGDYPGLAATLLATLTAAAARQLKVAAADLAADEELTEYGFDSIGFTQFANGLNDQLGLEVTPVLFFEHPTLAALADHLAKTHTAALAERLGIAAAPPSRPSPAPAPVPAPLPIAAPRPAAIRDDADDPVAVIGMAGLFPGAADVDAFWDNLAAGRDCVGEVPPMRWDWRAQGTLPHGAFIDGIDRFDPAFFGLSAPEARLMDPQQRLLLTQAWRLFEDAGIPPRRLSGSDTGVFIGIADTGYGRLLAAAGAGIEGHGMTGLAPSLGPNRISFHFNLHGPSVAVETACSSALVAIHRAVEAIRSGACEAAIAGGVNTLLLPDPFIGFAKAGMLSPTGRCRTFSDAADGYVRGEGVGLVLLKRLSAARRDGDRVVALIRASGENHGGRASSLTAPNPKAQADLLRAVHGRAGFDPRSLGYVEAHGTGTPLGDPIEVEALRAAFADLTAQAEDRFGPAPAMQCGLGSVKTNIGHLELAAGIAGLIKVLLQIRHRTLVKTLHCQRLNPYLKLEDGPFQVVRETRDWLPARDARGDALPLRAAVSSFGFGGANAHVVVEQAPEDAEAEVVSAATGPALLVLSAHSEDALRQAARDLAQDIGRHDLGQLAHALQTTRDAMEHRLAFAAASPAEARLRLDAFLAGEDDPALHVGRVKRNRAAVSVLESDAPVAAAIAGLAARGRADGLLELWAKGFAVDWAALHGTRRRPRLALPAYPLVQASFWPGPPVAAPTPRPHHPPKSEPLAEPAAASEAEAEAAEASDPVAVAYAALAAIAARVLEVDPAILDPDAELGEFGFDSISMTGFATQVNTELGLSLTPADFFEFATLDRLARHVAGSITPPPAKPKLSHQPAARAQAEATAAPMVVAAPLAPPQDDPVAIVGFSCHFPQSADADAFWDNLLNGRDCITRIPADRWDWRAVDGDPKVEHGKTNIHWGGFIDGVFQFDPLFFGISPREAKLMDPQQRLVMTHVWKAVEDAGHAPRSLAGRRVGLFVGTSSSGYRDIIGDDTGAEGYVATGAVPSVGPNRASFFLDWHGPSEPVETACSSSLVALHRAVQAMRAGDCDMAVVGGVNTIVTPEAHINFAKAGMLAPDGRCKTFSAQANGYGRGEGVGMLVLKFLSEAERDGDPIVAIVRASAVNHGGRANSLTAPNTNAQVALLREAQHRAGLDPATIGYVEAHGTGTALGDPIEINALKSVFAQAPGAAVGIGSVKTNIGHLELAAGAAGLIKVLLQMRHRTLAPSLHCAEMNPYIDLDGTPLRIVRQAEEWRPVLDAQGRPLPRRAGISSFGFGGVNAHVIVEEYQPPATAPAPAPHDGPLVLVLSARDADRLRAQAANLLAFIEAGRVTPRDLPDLAFTLHVGRDAMAHRWAAAVDDLDQARRRLTAFLGGDDADYGRLPAGHRAAPPQAPTLPAAELATRWRAGTEFDWAALYPQPRRRLRLPTYAFAPDVYHISGSFGALAAAAAQPAPFRRRLSADHFVLADHRVGGARILPGAMGLELARAACQGDRFAPLTLRRVVWQHPLRLDQGQVVVTVPLSPAEDGAQAFRLLSGGPDSVAHMLGQAMAPTAPPPPPLDLEAVSGRCPGRLSAPALYARYAALGLDYGPAFQGVDEVRLGDGEVLARLRLPDAATAEDFPLHPCMVDAAFQAAIGLFPDDGGNVTALPFGLDRAELLAPTTAAMWAHVRRAQGGNGLHKLDIDLTAEDGRVVARLLGFTLREMRKAPAANRDREGATRDHLAQLVAREAGLPATEIEAEAPLEAYGIDSQMILRLTEALEADFGPLPKTLFFEYRSVAALAGYFQRDHAAALDRLLGGAPTPTASIPTAPSPVGAPAVRPPVGADQPIAVVGMAGRFPGADDLEQFWRNLEQGRDCVTEVPAERWDHARYYDPRPGVAGKTNSKWGGFVSGHDRFDPLFFNISPREAEYLDPQERLFLQCAWETLEDAGLPRAALPRSAPPLDGADVGVFVGVMYEEYQLYGAERTAAGQPLALSGSAASIANRVSSFCGFHGPSLAVDSMCSSSLTALHLACESLRAGSCRMALAGGVNLTLHPNKYLGLAQGRFMASSGRCESFGQGGDGYVPGEGVGAVLLKPLADAERDGDRILGVIRATALNHGGHTNGYTVPNPAAQAAVIGRALDLAGVDPRQIGYVEAHGTGTALGDPIEIAALTRAFAVHTADTGFCAIGSVKSNIGHCESAAGMAGLAKVLLQMRHRTLVPSLHSRVLNPGIDFARTPFVVQQRTAPWPAPPGGGENTPRLAGLSSFGAGGANAHVVIQEYVAAPQTAQQRRRHVFPLSARDPQRLDEAIRRLRAALDRIAETDLAALAWTLQSGREAFEERFAVVADTLDRLKTALETQDGHRGRAGRGQPRLDQGDAVAVAAAWVAGAATDWAALWDGPRPRRLALPPYPFARDRYWVPGSPPVPAPVQTVPPQPVALPLLFAPRWQPAPATAGTEPPATRLVVLVAPPPRSVAALRAALAPARVEVVEAAPFADQAARLLALLQDLLRQRPDRALVQVAVANGEDGEALAGLLRAARLERPGLVCQMVALDLDSAEAGALLRADQKDGATDIRHQDGHRLVRRWHEIAPRPARPAWRDDGVYLITGGAGGIGRAVAAEIRTHAPAAAIWLVGRSAVPDLPAELTYRAADVTDEAAMRALVAEIIATHGRLTGVIHAAGLTRDSLLARKSHDDLRAVLAPKVAGTLALDAATAPVGLEFMVLFASVSGALGNGGQGDYATANAFLDLFAERRNRLVATGRRQGRTVAIDWPYWRDGGMRLNEAAIAAMERGAGVRALETDTALAALAAILAADGEDQVLVLDGQPDRLRGLLDLATAETPPPRQATAPASRAMVAACFSEVLKIAPEQLDPEAPLDRFGVDSVSALEIVAALERQVGPLPPTILFENPTIAQLAQALGEQAAPPPAENPASPVPTTQRPGDVAIIAVAGRYPGAATPEELWAALEQGRDLVGEVPSERWDPAYHPAKGKPGASHCKWGGFIDGVDRFDPAFFGYSPRAAALADPQERLFLETAWHLFERAGITRPALRRHYQCRVGVFVGAMYQHYGTLDSDADSKALVQLASYSAIANRVSFFFDLQGPSVAVDSMCSSGLQAVHQACQSLRAGECRLAVAGGVNLSLGPAKYQGLSRAGLVGSSADSRAFADGDGYLPAEAVGAVLLKPLADALADGDDVLAVIKASAANHGGHSAGFGVPSADAQARLIEETVRAAAIEPSTIGWVEAAANGAALGDGIEMRALARALSALGAAPGSVAVGTVKANMGHAEAASGLAQLTKVLMQLRHRRLPPLPRPTRPNPGLDFSASPLRPQWQAAEWPAPVARGEIAPRRALVSSFGAGGSNVHMVVEDAPPTPPAAADIRRPRRFPVSARTPEQLRARLDDLADFVAANPGLSLARLSHTLRLGRETMEHGVAVVATDAAELTAKLRAVRPGDPPESLDVPDGDEAGPMLVLPPYPFARERVWLPPLVPAPVPDAADNADSAEILALIVAVLKAELGVETIAPEAEFAQLGLDSMVALRLGYAIEEKLGLTLDRATLAQAASPAALAARLTGAAAPLQPSAPALSGPWRMAMTEGQKGLWVVQALYPDSAVYNVPVAFRLDGIDVAALERACLWLQQAFPLLTARVADDGDTPHLEASSTPRPLERIDLPKAVDPVDFARARAARPFDLTAEPPCRFELLGGGSGILLVLVHHLVFDGASAAVVAATLWDAYGRLVRGQSPAVPQGADFRAFAAWERDLLGSAAGQAQAAYWRRRLGGVLPVVDLPADRPARPGAAVDGRSLERRASKGLSATVKATARRLGVTPAALLLSALALLIQRHAGTDDMVIGVPFLRRPGRRFEQTVGYCVNMVAARPTIAAGDSGATLARRVHAELMAALDHGEIPFAVVARDLGGGLDGQPPYQVSFAYQNFPMPQAAPLPEGAGQVRFLPQLRQVGDGPFGLEVHDDHDGLRLVAGYDGVRFDPGTVETLLERFLRLTTALCADPDAPAATLPMLDAVELKRLTGRRARPPARPRRPGLVADWIAEQAKARPGSIAVQAGEDSLTYRRLIRRANRLARHMHEQGARRGDAVAVLLPRGTDSVVALLACLTLGVTWVPLDPGQPPARLAAMRQDCGARLTITKDGAATDGIDLIRDAKAIAAQSARRPKTRPRPGDAAYMIYTSGSTGAPKGVLVPHRALAEHVAAITPEFALTADDVVLHFAPETVDTAIEQVVPTLAAGARVLMRTGAPWSPDDLARVLAEHRVTVADLPPAYLREAMLSWGAAPPPPALRLLVVGGEALPADTVRLWQDGPLSGIRLLNAYGPTEATVTCLVHHVDRAAPPGAAVPIGRPLPGTRAMILDHAGNVVPAGVIGELHVGGRRLATGYHRRPDLTAERFVDSPWGRLYRTGDLASWLPGGQGVVAFHGRLDHQVKIRGFRVELSEVEAALAEAGLREWAVVPRRDGAGDGVLVAYGVPGEHGWDEAALRAHMAARLPSPMLPVAYVPMAALPLTASGKLDRAALPEPLGAPRATARPRDALEQRLTALWARVLGRDADSIGINDDFVDCGGHSLAWVRLLAEIGRAFACRPTAADFLSAQTVAEQAAVLRSWPAAEIRGKDGVVPLRPHDGGSAPPLFLVHAAAGTVECYVGLARRLTSPRPILGLAAPAAAMADLPALAAAHVAEIRRVQPTGPYHLAGWSLGGVVAFEMARQLRQDGEAVALLCLIDSYTPAQLARIDALAGQHGDPVELALQRDMATSGDDVRMDALRAAYRAHDALLAAYVPTPVDVTLTLLRAAGGGDDQGEGWRPLAAAGLTVLPVPGNHFDLLRPPNLDVCAQRLDQALLAATKH